MGAINGILSFLNEADLLLMVLILNENLASSGVSITY